MSWCITGVGKILGVKLYYSLPILDGFRLIYKDGTVARIDFHIEEDDDGYLYLFTHAVELKGNEEATLQVHCKIGNGRLVKADLIVETLEPRKIDEDRQ